MSTKSLRSAAAASATADVTSVPLIHIQRELAELRPQLDAAVAGVLDSAQFVLGPETVALEAEIAQACSAVHGVGCASGSDALLLSLMALGVGPGDEVIVPSFTFFATASAVTRVGAKLVFADIDPSTFNLCPVAIAEAITPATRAIIPVHLFGQCADMRAICSVATEHGISVVEDAAQALGAELWGRPAGAWGDVTCFSFYPTKNLGGCGDGGMMVTSNDELAGRLRLLRVHGMQPRYYHQFVGVNSRLDAIQAAILRVKLRHLKRWTSHRQALSRRYEERFSAIGLDGVLSLPRVAEQAEHVWNQYTVRVPSGQRDALREHLCRVDVGTEIYYPIPLHEQECFADVSSGELPHTKQAALEVLSLPIFPTMTAAEQDYVVDQIAGFFHNP